MSASASHTVFATCHATVPAVLFGGAVALTMFAVHPVAATVSLAGALLFSFLVRGARATLRGLCWQVPFLLLVCAANPFFVSSGSTVVLRVGSVVVFAESLAYGAVMGELMVAVVLWFEGAAQVLTQDRLFALMGRRARAVPLLVSMAAQLMPQLVRRGREVEGVRRACTAAGAGPAGPGAGDGAPDGGEGPRRARASRQKGLVAGLTRTSGMLLQWALEDSLERSDALRARGWESGCARTSWRPERFGARDAALVALVVLLVATSGFLLWVACSQWSFYPVMPRLVAWWGYVPFALLCLLPSFFALWGRA